MPRKNFLFVPASAWPGGTEGDGTDLLGVATFQPPQRNERRNVEDELIALYDERRAAEAEA